MKAGDYIVVTENRDLAFVTPGERLEDDQDAIERRGRFLGIVIEVREPQDNSVVAVKTSFNDVEPPLATVGTLRRFFT